ncbi:hypothetical protein [Natrinema thermotolerans]|uniref:hypothetical protein n=1 Tax=Natrinema thermotolerans TaxID=121872 RepID=UPI000679725F|nr:hypothetical protein [Natrinema thermotolerans]QCC57259.1 hypothetical protein DVR14_00875 [Natrinema thermotolerans]
MSALDVQEYVTDSADSRGRVNVGTGHGDTRLTYVVLDPDSLERRDGPNTKTVQSDGRLSIGSAFAGEEVTVGIVTTHS